MCSQEERNEPDPAAVQPTDNSSGVPVDLDRLEDLQDEPQAGEP